MHIAICIQENLVTYAYNFTDSHGITKQKHVYYMHAILIFIPLKLFYHKQIQQKVQMKLRGLER